MVWIHASVFWIHARYYLGTEMYLQQPPGYVDPNFKACCLLRPLEGGTKQAGNLWMVGNT